ncbi:uncharacterized protein BKA78DRAFT_190911 [Phyllosticta capitalensis]|uniref:uncharacterized protein n=1 Tax=Phyllosticta capitalensis TaxID=121624 RepID=UPI00312EFB17
MLACLPNRLFCARLTRSTKTSLSPPNPTQRSRPPLDIYAQKQLEAAAESAARGSGPDCGLLAWKAAVGSLPRSFSFSVVREGSLQVCQKPSRVFALPSSPTKKVGSSGAGGGERACQKEPSAESKRSLRLRDPVEDCPLPRERSVEGAGEGGRIDIIA